MVDGRAQHVEAVSVVRSLQFAGRVGRAPRVEPQPAERPFCDVRQLAEQVSQIGKRLIAGRVPDVMGVRWQIVPSVASAATSMSAAASRLTRSLQNVEGAATTHPVVHGRICTIDTGADMPQAAQCPEALDVQFAEGGCVTADINAETSMISSLNDLE